MTADLLFNALDNADMIEVNALLEKFPELVNAHDAEGRVPLHYAADCADFSTFKRILELNPELVDVQDKVGFTPLLICVMNGNLETMQVLIEHGAQIAHVDHERHSTVHWAVVCAQLEVLDFLLKRGASIETTDTYGARPLHYATVIEDVSVERSETILHVLLKEGANIDCMDNDGRTPLIWAASNGNVEGFKSLIQAGANKFARDHDRLGVLHCAAYHGNSEIIKNFLDQTVSKENIINTKDRNGDTPLFYACTYGHYECAKVLLDRGADANHMDKRCRSAAHCAAAKGQLRILKLLKQYGASFELQNHRGDLPFHEAVQTGSQGLVEWLLQLEPSFISAPNFYGRAPLHLTAASGNMELTVLLCTRGAEINPLMLYKNDLYSPLDLARRRKHDLIVEYLSQRHKALTAAQISVDKQNTLRQDIEEGLKTAKLRRIQAQFSDSDDDYVSLELINGFSVGGKKYRIFRRGKSMLYDEPQHRLANMYNGRNTKSALEIRLDSLPKSTSTTDLIQNHDNDKNNKVGFMYDAGNNYISNFEKQLVESTIQKIVQEQLCRTAPNTIVSVLENSKNVFFRNIQRVMKNIICQNKSNVTCGIALAKPVSDQTPKNLSPSESSFVDKPYNEQADVQDKKNIPVGNGVMVQSSVKNLETSTKSAVNLNEGEPNKVRKRVKLIDVETVGNDSFSSSGYGERLHKVLFSPPPPVASGKQLSRRNTSFSSPRNTDDEDYSNQENNDDLGVTELHIIEDGWQSNDVKALFSGSTAERRYIHEKAIFEELTHLKRMQIQYGRVQEKILVRSLVANFCKMHGLHTSHFRCQTFYEWEKFLYDLLSDQLKMIYLEERDRIQMAASLSRSENGGNGSYRSITGRHITSPSSKFENKLHKMTPLDERLRELTRIYSNSSISSMVPRLQRSISRPRNPNKQPLSKEKVKLRGQHHSHADANNRKRCECFSRHSDQQQHQRHSGSNAVPAK